MLGIRSNKEKLLQGEQMETSQTELETIQVEKGSTSAPSKKEPKKSRERKLTEKMLDLRQQEISQKEIKWIKLYESWKDQTKDTRVKLKDECSEENLGKMMDAVEGLETRMKRNV